MRIESNKYSLFQAFVSNYQSGDLVVRWSELDNEKDSFSSTNQCSDRSNCLTLFLKMGYPHHRMVFAWALIRSPLERGCHLFLVNNEQLFLLDKKNFTFYLTLGFVILVEPKILESDKVFCTPLGLGVRGSQCTIPFLNGSTTRETNNFSKFQSFLQILMTCRVRCLHFIELTNNVELAPPISPSNSNIAWRNFAQIGRPK